MRTLRKIVLAAVVLGPPVVVPSTGCIHFRSPIQQDLQAAGKFPSAFGDGIVRDVLIYRPAPDGAEG